MHRLFVALAQATTANAAYCGEPKAIAELNRIGREIVQNRCSTPLQRTERKVSYQHEPSVTDRVFVHKCTGYSAKAYFAGSYNPPAKLPLSLRVSIVLPELPKLAQPGTQIEGVLRALGKPRHRTQDAINFSLSEESPD